MELVISYDMRAPAFGAHARELYAAALDQVAWADALGFDTVGLGEHHAAPDGYNPSPLMLGAAAYLVLFFPVVVAARWVETRFAWKR